MSELMKYWPIVVGAVAIAGSAAVGEFRLNLMEEAIAEIEEGVDEIEDEVERIDRRVESHGNKINMLDADIDGLYEEQSFK